MRLEGVEEGLVYPEWIEEQSGRRELTVGRQETMGGVEVFSGVINRSRMLPLVWVGKVTCCVRLKSDRVDRNWAV